MKRNKNKLPKLSYVPQEAMSMIGVAGNVPLIWCMKHWHKSISSWLIIKFRIGITRFFCVLYLRTHQMYVRFFRSVVLTTNSF